MDAEKVANATPDSTENISPPEVPVDPATPVDPEPVTASDDDGLSDFEDFDFSGSEDKVDPEVVRLDNVPSWFFDLMNETQVRGSSSDEVDPEPETPAAPTLAEMNAATRRIRR